jgi:RHS repeat-associated protein
MVNGSAVSVNANLQNLTFTTLTFMVPNVGSTSCTVTPLHAQLIPNSDQLTADPISTATGALVVPNTVDLALGGPLPLFLRRSYSTLTLVNSAMGILGTNWATNFDPFITGDSKYAAVILEDGRVTFQVNGTSFQPVYPPRLPYQLVRPAAGGYRFLDPARNLIYNFNSNGHLVKIEDRNGNALTIIQGAFGPTQVSDGLGRTLSFTYTGNSVSKVTDQSGRSVSYTHGNLNLTTFTDANGNTTTYTYNPFGEITKTAKPRGNVPYSQNYDPFFRVSDQTDSLGNKTTMSYPTAATPGLTKTTDPLGRTTSYNYSNLVDLSSVTDALGQTSSIAYDSFHRPVSLTDRLGNKTTVTYDTASSYVSSITDAQGNTTSFTYQAQVQGDFTFYNRTKITFPDGTSESFSYDAAGNVLKATDRAGKTTSYAYNSRGQTLTKTNPAGGVTTYTYNSDGTIATIKLPSGDTSSFSYDTLKRVSKIQYADNTSVSFTRDALDNILSVVDERGKVTKIAYDANNKVQSATDALNQTSKLTYDTDDLPATASDRLGNTTKFQYDALGSPTAITNAAGEKTTLSYDKLDRVASVADPSGKTSTFTYDAESRLASATNPLGNTVSMKVNKNGFPTQFTLPLGENTSMTYDTMDRVTGITDALGRQNSFAYDSRDLITAINAPGALTASFAWGDLGLLSSATDPNGNIWTIARDNLGRVTSQTDPLGQTGSYKYDARSRISSVTTPIDSVNLTYDPAGNLTSVQFSDNTGITYAYDDDNRLTAGTGFTLGYDAAGRVTSSNGIKIVRDAVGRISAITYPAGTVKYTYDSRGLLSGVSDWTGGSVSFIFNDAHQLVSLTRSNGVVTQYTYDKDGRLASITDTGGGNTLASVSLARDAIGRVTSSDRNLPQEATPPVALTASSSYDAANQISGATYDARGRLTADNAGSTYVWNSASRLVSYTRPDGSASFTYDGLGQRISRTGPDGSTSNYVLNYATALPSIATVQSGGTDVRYFVYTPGGSLLFSIDAASGAHRFYSVDDAGSTTMLTDDSGSITDTYGISPYGDVVTPGPNNSADNPFTWQGQFGVMQEPGTGLFYARFRYYDNGTARFLSRDPIVSPTPREMNPYQYAAGDPVDNTDAMGLKSASTFSMLASTGTATLHWVAFSIMNRVAAEPAIAGESPASVHATLSLSSTAVPLVGTPLFNVCGSGAGNSSPLLFDAQRVTFNPTGLVLGVDPVARFLVQSSQALFTPFDASSLAPCSQSPSNGFSKIWVD